MLRLSLPAVSLLVVAVAVSLSAQAPPSDAGRRLHALFDQEWEWELQQSPTSASALGDKRWNDRWDDLSIAALDARQAHRTSVLAALDAIPRDQLSASDQGHYDVFRYQYRMTVEGYQYRYQLIRTDTYGGVQNSEQLVDSLSFATRKDYDDWLARLAAFPVYIDQNIALMREGLRTNVLLPKVIMARVRGQLDQLVKGEPAQSGFYGPFRRFPAAIAESDRASLAAAGLEQVRTHVVPAFARLRDFVDQEYLPHCYDQVGWSQTSSGEAGYAYFARLYTTTGLTPQEIHQIGLKEVARIRSEMERIKSQTGFTGSLQAFFTFLRTDPRFFYTSGPELLEAYRALAKRIDPELIKADRHAAPAALWRPGHPGGGRTQCDDGVCQLRRRRRIPPRLLLRQPLQTPDATEVGDAVAHSSRSGPRALPAGIDRAGIERPAGLPPQCRLHGLCRGVGPVLRVAWRRHGVVCGRPVSRFGKLTYEMWRAVRLVVDTGMHVMHWDREKAIAYFMDNAAKTELDVTNEIDRYISWPGQALAYKVGELKIRELRTRAEQRLGSRFDLRKFNDVVLHTGPVPLEVLEQQVNAWLDAQPRQ